MLVVYGEAHPATEQGGCLPISANRFQNTMIDNGGNDIPLESNRSAKPGLYSIPFAASAVDALVAVPEAFEAGRCAARSR